jgi:TorA maturation chaperone TorD
LLGGLTLDGAKVELLREVQREKPAVKLAAAIEGELGVALGKMQRAIDDDDPETVAAEYTRLMVANAEGGARSRLPVPPWEDCYTGGERHVLGARSRTTLHSYAAARLGFDGMTEQPADHIGLQLCFVAALLDEEVRGERDDTARSAFVTEHLKTFSPALGRTLADAARKAFWREAGRAIALLPGVLCDSPSLVPSPTGLVAKNRSKI